jgi:hypothetical protein
MFRSGYEMTDKEKWMKDTLKKIEDLYYESCDHKLNRVSSALGMVEDTIMHEQKRLEEDTEDHALATFTAEY